jgi:hypothetical protein
VLAEKKTGEIEMILWRAASDDLIVGSASFAETREAAELYLNNPGFGGDTLYFAEVEIDDYLDLTGDDALERLQESLDDDHDYGAIGIDELVPRVSRRLAEAGVQWVKVCESYPEHTITWIFVGGDEPELIEVCE